MPSFLEYVEKNGTLPTCLAMSVAAYIAFFSSDIQELNDQGLLCRRPKGNAYTCSDDRWALEFYYDHRADSEEDLVHAVMSNEQMWGQNLTKIPGFEDATVENLKKIRKDGALAAADLMEQVLEIASGKQTWAERKGFREISILKDGVVL